MIDINKQVSYWRDGALEDWDAVQNLYNHGYVRQALFFAHLVPEKMIKAHVCLATQDIAPRIHNLVRLAELTNLVLLPTQIKTLAKMNEFNIEGRYPDQTQSPPTAAEAAEYIQQTREMMQWLTQQL